MDINLISRINKNFADARTVDIKKSLHHDIKEKNKKAMHEACRGFESIFVDAMLKSMRKTIPVDKLFGDGNGMDIYKTMYDQYLARDISERDNGIGLENFLYKKISASK